MIRTDSVLRTFQIGFARIHGQLGWASLAGLLLMLVATGIGASAWTDRRAAIESLARPSSSPTGPGTRAQAPAAAAAAAASSFGKLPAMSELPGLLTDLETIAVDNRLGWNAAEYRLLPASDRTPASAEIRTRFVGTYTQIRRMVTQVLDRVPGVSFRQLSITRPSTDADEVEAKVVFAILLADGAVGLEDSTSAHQGTDTSRVNTP